MMTPGAAEVLGIHHGILQPKPLELRTALELQPVPLVRHWKSTLGL